MTASTESKNIKKNIPVGSGNIDFKNKKFSTFGITGKQKAFLEAFIESEGGILTPPGNETDYLIYHPTRAKKLRQWFKILDARSKNRMYIMKPEIFLCWADRSYSIASQPLRVRLSICRHFLKYRNDWNVDLYDRIPEIEDLMLSEADKVFSYFADTEDKPYLTDLYLKWGHEYKNGEWFRKIRFRRLSFNAAMAFIADYLNETSAWEAADDNTKRAINHFMDNNITELCENLYRNGRYKTLCLYFDHLSEHEKNWTMTGYSDGFFVYFLLNRYLERAIADNDLNSKSFFMNYKAEHFDEDFIEAAEENELDIEFGLKFRPPAYFIKGASLTFGSYKYSEDGKINAPIEWEVLKQEDGRVLIMTKQAVFSSAMNLNFRAFTWEDCIVRNWLNDTFLKEAFTTEEKERIMEVSNNNSKNKKWKTPSGNDTVDSVFILSADEARKHLPGRKLRLKTPTPFAAKHLRVINDQGHCCWWLRTNGMSANYMTYVYTDGKIIDTGDNGSPFYGICPALWLSVHPDHEQ